MPTLHMSSCVVALSSRAIQKRKGSYNIYLWCSLMRLFIIISIIPISSSTFQPSGLCTCKLLYRDRNSCMRKTG
ncbi:hypothetical protein CC80DRAFT_496636 [Byssothecium circinans]|uniref:Uncharacterized protein n=1 Tax=Byssothecium circinans TaxID=147558 RepID=A0A6A5TGF6_9PLEO|nr:hypothetical protein CC80DRAFT_496636 [Byssothecium circinans]